MTGIAAVGRGRFAITVGDVTEGSVDIRESIARMAVEGGLLSMTAERALEDVFLKLTETPGVDA